jgi:hypothetical protein
MPRAFISVPKRNARRSDLSQFQPPIGWRSPRGKCALFDGELSTRAGRLFATAFTTVVSIESRQSAACGSPPRRAYRRYWRRGRVAEGGGLLNRYRVVKPYRGFESLRLRQSMFCPARTHRLRNVPKKWVTTSCRTGCRAVTGFSVLLQIEISEI